MKIAELFESAEILGDTKARRVLNTSEVRANISADELENGVTLERLESLNVPVYRYGTQITIHGVVADFDENARPAGYRSIFRNQNGTVGVRYVGIDAAKKQQVVEACSRAHSDAYEPGADRSIHKWGARITSVGMTIIASFPTKEECIAAYRAFPRDLFYGSIDAFAGIYGDFYVEASVGAIPEASLWPLISRLWNISSLEEFTAREALAKERSRVKEIERKAEMDAALAQRRATANAFAATVPLRKLNSISKKPCEFVRCGVGLSGQPSLWLVRFVKRGPALCYLTLPYDLKTGAKEDPSRKAHRLEDAKFASLQEDATRGLLFAA